eukprot:Phypoly_transcript_01008.p1 GENE.Phypoly_transcript_01008~~Phypoly_transcript_01008.p1  ORF type:complete len:1023 (-),score=208.76 Phypoly_transcript_01008:373-3441(-)
MPKKRKSLGEDEFTPDVNPSSTEIYEKGGRVLRARDTCQCPVCGVFFSPTEIQAHAQACLYFLEHEADVKKKKKSMSSSSSSLPVTPTKVPNLSKSDSGIGTDTKTTPPRPKVVTTKWKPNTVSQWNLPYAPVFRPSIAEFKRPLDYISKIRPIAEKYGICVIVPPYQAESWNQSIGDPKTFLFRTKVQHIHQLKTRWQGRNEVFLSNLASFLEKRGEPLRVMPRVEGRDLDLFKLFTSVVNRGGYQVVERANLWKSVADDLKFSIVCVRNNTLRNHYHKYLYAYEMYRKSKLQFRPASSTPNPEGSTEDDDLYIAEDITCDLYNTDYMEEDGSDDDEFGFYEGEEYTLSKFEKKARSFSEKWFPTRPTAEQVEEEFWRIVETAEDSVKVDYGSDIDVTKSQRSGFPRDRMDGVYVTEEGTHWNLNRLPRMRGSVLSHIKETVAGVTDPMLYVGMLFSSFCWHTEDNYLYSINYMHKGTAKTWYGVPASGAEHFEEVMKATLPDLFAKHPDLLHLLITMISPAVLAENKVPIVRAVQEPGQYVITFPKAYHAGFSHGFTCAEAVNFAPADWLPYGYESVLHYRAIKRQSVFSHEQLLFTIANRDPSPETAYWVCGELQKSREKEQSARDLLRLAGLSVQILSPPQLGVDPKQCKVCSYDCFLSSITCACSPQYVACIAHHAELCESCSAQSKVLQVLVPLSDMDALIEKTRKIQLEVKPVIDLTDDDDIRSSTLSLPNLANMNNVTNQPPPPAPTPPPTSPAKTPTRSPANPPAQPKPHAQKTSAQLQTPTQSTQAPAQPSQTPTQSTQATPAPAQSTQPAQPTAPGDPAQATKDPPTEPTSPSPPATTSPPVKGIVINLSNKAQKAANATSPSSPPAASSPPPPAPNPYENKIPPPPTILRPPTTSNLSVSSLTTYAAKQNISSSHVPSHSSSHPPPPPSSSPHPSPSPSFSSPSPSPAVKPPHNYYPPTHYPEGERGGEMGRETPPSPSLIEPMQGIALTSNYTKKPKPVTIILDSPTKA